MPALICKSELAGNAVEVAPPENNLLEALAQELQLAKVEAEKRDSEIESLKATIEKLKIEMVSAHASS